MSYYKKHHTVSSGKTVDGEVHAIVDLLVRALQQELLGYADGMTRFIEQAETKARLTDFNKIAGEVKAIQGTAQQQAQRERKQAELMADSVIEW